MYLARKTDALAADFKNSLEAFLEDALDNLDLIELVISKVRLDLISELERDIMKLYRVDPSREDNSLTSQKK